MNKRRQIIKVAATAALIGIIAPLLRMAIVQCCYQQQWPLTADGPLPTPRFVDHAVTYSELVWPGALIVFSPIVPNQAPTKAEFYGQFAGAIIVNAAIYAAVACAAFTLWRRFRASP